jgi:hypothetical protein
LQAYDVVVVFVAFKALRAAPVLNWSGYRGLRVLMDHDIVQNYSDIFDPALAGAWPEVFHRHRFNSIVTSGRMVQTKLHDDGIPSDWIAKAFEPKRFNDGDAARSGVVTYGSAYVCRQIAERAVRDAGLPLTRIPMTPYLQLGTVLSEYLACMAVSSDLEIPAASRAGLEYANARKIAMRPGLEPMAKFFEAAGAGCCPVADAMDDLAHLGFRDGETALTFSTHAELVEKLQAMLAKPSELRAMGVAAANLAHAQHTWSHRALELRNALLRRL